MNFPAKKNYYWYLLTYAVPISIIIFSKDLSLTLGAIFLAVIFTYALFKDYSMGLSFGTPSVSIDEENIAIKKLFRKPVVWRWPDIRSLTIGSLEQARYGVGRVDQFLVITGPGAKIPFFPERIPNGLKLVEEIIARIPVPAVDPKIHSYLDSLKTANAPLVKKYKFSMLILIISALILAIALAIGFQFFIVKMQQWYFSFQAAASDKFYSDIRIAVVVNAFIFFFVLIALAEKLQRKILGISAEQSENLDDAAFQNVSLLDHRLSHKNRKFEKGVKIVFGFFGAVLLLLDILLFFSFVKVGENGITQRTALQQIKKYDWPGLEKIEMRLADDGNKVLNLWFKNEKTLTFVVDAEADEVAEFARQKTGLSIQSTIDAPTNSEQPSGQNVTNDYTTPANTFISYRAAAGQENVEGYLAALTQESSDWMRTQTAGLTRLKAEYNDLIKSEFTVEYKDDYALIISTNLPDTIPPYRLIQEGGLWKIDLIYMRDHIQFGTGGKWHYK